ncbi:hypothetical protein OOJ96_20275 [Pseudomonas sp. 15FMM2]|uniref:Uncharacterized protein n=1 Tax=Pseudomonas imrae TaxID=2992837 RepID=A0ACC7PHK0_9PSED
MSSMNISNVQNVVCDCSVARSSFPDVLDKSAPLHSKGINFSSSSTAANESVVQLQAGLGDVGAAFQKIASMFTSLFDRLLTMFSNKVDGGGGDLDIESSPVLPKVTPEVIPPTQDTTSAPLPDLSSKRNGAKADNIWSGFRQGPDGNCVTVSAIKAAMHKFGQSPTDIYKQVKKLSDGYSVTMRDGFELTLTSRELAAGVRGARFFGNDKGMLKDAQFMFAVSAKRAYLENNDGRAARSFDAAVRSLNDGEDERGAGEGFKRLGLKEYMRSVPVSALARGQIGMVNRTGHSVAVIEGREELWGRQGGRPTHGQAVALVG